MLANMEMEGDEDDEGAALVGGVDDGDDDLILAGENENQEVDENGVYTKGKPIEIKSWLQWYLALEDHDFLVEVERDFLKDKFNLINLRETCGNPPPMSKSRFKETLRLILSSKVPNEQDLQSASFLELNQDAFDIYGRLHARFVATPTGLAKIYHKYLSGVYGACPRLHCDRQRLLPLGMSDKPRASRVKVYCPRCEESYVPNRLSNHQAR
jgi:casein kinase II subunit beta